MALYVITYDIRATNRHDYKPLWECLRNWGGAHLQNSVWLGELKGPSAAIRDVLISLLHADDTFCVIQIFPNSDWACWKARDEGAKWLQSHCKP